MVRVIKNCLIFLTNVIIWNIVFISPEMFNLVGLRFMVDVGQLVEWESLLNGETRLENVILIFRTRKAFVFLPESVVLSFGDFSLKGTSGSVWKHFLIVTQGYYWYSAVEASVPINIYNARDPKLTGRMSAALRLKNPAWDEQTFCLALFFTSFLRSWCKLCFCDSWQVA